MKKRIFSVRTLLSGVLAMLGFAGCEKAWNGECEYGMPMVDYRVIGEVTDEAGKPLSGIRAIIEQVENYNVDTVYTDAKGHFESKKLKSVAISQQNLILEDVDGEANGGEFESTKLPIKEMDSKKIKKGDGWYSGEYELSTMVQMKKK